MTELIREIQMNVDTMYQCEDDAMFIRDNLDNWENHEYESEEAAESEAEGLDNQAYQMYRVIESDLAELSEILGREIKLEDFTDGEFKS